MGRAALSLKQKKKKKTHFLTLAISSFHQLRLLLLCGNMKAKAWKHLTVEKEEATQRGYTVNTHNVHENAQACSIVMWIFVFF